MPETTSKSIFDQVNAVLDEARPALESHNGGIQLIEVTDDGVVRVTLRGACVGCSLSSITMRMGVERLLKSSLPNIVSALEEV